MGFDKRSDAFEVEAVRARCDEEGLADGYCKEACRDRSVGVYHKRERGRTDATIGDLQLVGSDAGRLVVGTGNRESRCWADDGGEILEVLQRSRTIRHR